MKQWICVIVNRGRDLQTAQMLRRRNFPVVVAKTFSKPEGTKRIEPVCQLRFEGYIFVAVDLAKEEHGLIKTTRGVAALMVGADGEPEPLPPGYIAKLHAMEDDELMEARARAKPPEREELREGDQVEVNDDEHPFHGQVGKLVNLTPKRAKLYIGRNSATIDPNCLKKVEAKK